MPPEQAPDPGVAHDLEVAVVVGVLPVGELPSSASSANIAFGIVSSSRASSASPSLTFGPGTSIRKRSDAAGR